MGNDAGGGARAMMIYKTVTDNLIGIPRGTTWLPRNEVKLYDTEEREIDGQVEMVDVMESTMVYVAYVDGYAVATLSELTLSTHPYFRKK